ncbi:hypothetical protein I302_104764 [Kwoniella bestiolae CBS 10118]|uniref:Phytocyanin domain-containing protein n=1 Tax=Kwoniella bestiolae CBS 10118 TaxID=1296100 RepID=A0A1B9FRT5_9TREE|nr:hypothetical protein I302_09166 [Kwoniella bestiolae CBS 10118]OCF21487.1 hypothetical protein I302_09166 [Kwoniella bestiolae CBS 10118]
MIATQVLTLLPILSTLVHASPHKRTDEWASKPESNSWDSGSSYDSGYSYSSEGSGESYNSGGSYDSNSYEGSGNSYDSSWQSSGGEGHATTIKHQTTITTHLAYETPKYGSGSMWGGDLQGCLNMCQAQFGGGSSYAAQPTTTAAPAAESTAATATEGGGGAMTHTVVVAPTKGVLRFVPFAIEGKEGDTVEFVWGAGPHSATLSEGQNVCNRSTTANAFDSGKLNATATFQSKIIGSSPQFHYCTVGTHCTSGMFGIINPPNNSTPPAAAANASSAASSSASVSVEASKTTSEKPSSTAGDGKGKGGCESVDCWVSSWEASGAQPKATVAAVKSACQGTDGAWAWGGKWDMSTVLVGGVSKDSVVENILYSRLMIAMNPTMLVAGSPMGNFTAPPPLNEFVAAAAPAADSSTAPATVSAGAEGAAATDASASASAGASQEAANAGSSTSGAGKTGIALATILLSATGTVMSLLL